MFDEHILMRSTRAIETVGTNACNHLIQVHLIYAETVKDALQMGRFEGDTSSVHHPSMLACRVRIVARASWKSNNKNTVPNNWLATYFQEREVNVLFYRLSHRFAIPEERPIDNHRH